MRDQKFELIRREAEFVLPQVAKLGFAVVLGATIEAAMGEAGAVATSQPLCNENRHRIAVTQNCAEVEIGVQQRADARFIELEEYVAVIRSRVLQVTTGKQQAGRLNIAEPSPFIPGSTGDRGQRQAKTLAKPRNPTRESAAHVRS